MSRIVTFFFFIRNGPNGQRQPLAKTAVHTLPCFPLNGPAPQTACCLRLIPTNTAALCTSFTPAQH